MMLTVEKMVEFVFRKCDCVVWNLSGHTGPAHYTVVTASLACPSLLAAKTLATRHDRIGIRSGQRCRCASLSLWTLSASISACCYWHRQALAQRPPVHMITPWPACVRWGPHHSSLPLQLTIHQGWIVIGGFTGYLNSAAMMVRG